MINSFKMKKIKSFQEILIFFIIAIVFIKLFLQFSKTPEFIIMNMIYGIAMTAFIILYILRIKEKKNKISRKNILFLILIILVGAFFKLYFVNEPLSYTEVEWNYKSLAKEIILKEPVRYYTDHPNLMTTVLTSFFLLFGIKSASVTLAGITIYILTCIAIFITAKEFFGKEKEGLISVIIFSVLPQTFIYQTTGEAEPLASLFLIIILFLLWKSLQERKYFIPTILLSALHTNLKPEMGIYIAPIMFCYIYFDKTLRKKLFRGLKLFLIAALPGYIYLMENRGFKHVLSKLFPRAINFYTNEAPANYSIKANVSSFFSSIFNFSKHPLIIFPFLITSFLDWKKSKKPLVIILSFLLTYSFFYSIFVYAYHFRYIIVIYPLISILVAHGIINISSIMKKIIKPNLIISTIIIAIILSVQIPPDLNDGSISLEIKTGTIKDVNYYLDNDTVILCQINDVCDFELLPKKSKQSIINYSKRAICIQPNTDNYCEEYRDKFNNSREIIFNQHYQAFELYN